MKLALYIMVKKTLAHPFALFSSLPSLSVFCLLGLYFASVFFKPTLSVDGAQQLQTAAYQPLTALAHHGLAKLYIQVQAFAEAEKELQLADESLAKSVHTPQVLGLTSDINTLQQELQEKPLELQNEQNYWLNITEKYPTYRDAWIQLWHLALEANDSDKANFYKQHVLKLDPNFQFPNTNEG